MLFYCLALLFPTLMVLGYWRSLFGRVARRLGLERVAQGYAGEIDGVRVSLGKVHGGGGSPFAVFASAPGLVSLGLEKHSSGAPRPVLRLATGDEAFDGAITVCSEPATALAVLDGDARAQLLDVRRRAYVRIDGGAVELRPSGLPTARKIHDLVLDAVALAKRFAVPEAEHAPRLAQVATGDEDAAVRRHALAALVASRLDDPLARSAADAAGADPDDGVRLIAALARGEANAMDTALLSADPVIRELAVVLLGQGDRAASTEALVAALDPPPPEHIALKIIQLLARSGTPLALAPIARAARRFSAPLREAADEALEAIKHRGQLAESHGALSLAEGTGGEVSLAADTRGALSKPER